MHKYQELFLASHHLSSTKANQGLKAMERIPGYRRKKVCLPEKKKPVNSSVYIKQNFFAVETQKNAAPQAPGSRQDAISKAEKNQAA